LNKSKPPTGYRFEPIWRADDSPALLVDDNCLTGETLRYWKQAISENCSRPVITFALTVTGRIEPDYYHSRKWRSFAWRPVGL
jgi:hypoxanthine phosphoribosyltransferase